MIPCDEIRAAYRKLHLYDAFNARESDVVWCNATPADGDDEAAGHEADITDAGNDVGAIGTGLHESHERGRTRLQGLVRIRLAVSREQCISLCIYVRR